MMLCVEGGCTVRVRMSIRARGRAVVVVLLTRSMCSLISYGVVWWCCGVVVLWCGGGVVAYKVHVLSCLLKAVEIMAAHSVGRTSRR